MVSEILGSSDRKSHKERQKAEAEMRPVKTYARVETISKFLRARINADEILYVDYTIGRAFAIPQETSKGLSRAVEIYWQNLQVEATCSLRNRNPNRNPTYAAGTKEFRSAPRRARISAFPAFGRRAYRPYTSVTTSETTRFRSLRLVGATGFRAEHVTDRLRSIKLTDARRVLRLAPCTSAPTSSMSAVQFLFDCGSIVW